MTSQLIYTVLLYMACTAMGDVTVTSNLIDSGELVDDSSDEPSMPGVQYLKQTCLRNADLAAFQEAKQALEDMPRCLQSIVNTSEMREEFGRATFSGNLNPVIKKYCRKAPEFLNCSDSFTNRTERCFDASERTNSQVLQNVSTTVLNFACFKDGFRISQFLANGGRRCLSFHQEGIRQCLNHTMTTISSREESTDLIPQLDCKDVRSLQTCVVGLMESCADRTPGNIVDAMLNAVYNVTPCKPKSDASV